MEQKQWNPLVDIASVLGSIARLLPPLPTLPELPRAPQSYHVPEPKLGPKADVTDILSTNQMKEEQKRQAEQGLVVFKYE